MKTARCKSEKCKQPVIWCETVKGNLMPVDAGLSPEGQWRIEDADSEKPKAFFVPQSERAGRHDLRQSHYATCPDASSFRARKAG